MAKFFPMAEDTCTPKCLFKPSKTMAGLYFTGCVANQKLNLNNSEYTPSHKGIKGAT